MLYLATVSFSGKISMSKGEVGEISDQTLVDDLMKAGYIIPYEKTNKDEKADKPTTKRKGKADGKSKN